MYEARHMCHSYMWHDCMCDMTHSYVWHDSLICVTWLTHMCDMIHSCVWHDLFMCVTWLIHVCDMIHSHAWHDSFICVTWFICMYEARHTYAWVILFVFNFLFPCSNQPDKTLSHSEEPRSPRLKIVFLICLSKLNHVVVPSQQPGKYRDSTEQLITRSLLPIGLLDLSYRWVRLINRAGVRRDLSNKVARDWNQEEEDVKEKSRPDPWLGCCTFSPAA